MKRVLDQLTQFLVQRSHQKYPRISVAGATLFGSTLELIVIPTAFVVIGKTIDSKLGLGPLLPEFLVPYMSALCFLMGIPWLAWAIYWQHRFGKGTPLPLVPTKIFLETGPYRYMRNPMNFGAIFWLAGWAVLANSRTAFWGGTGVFMILVISYIKLVEEKELEERFGIRYRKYKKRTPFLIPRFK